MAQEPWIGVDLDGTLAEYSGLQGHEHIGKPVPAMLQLVKEWLADDIKVKIFTARVSGDKAESERARYYIKKWLEDECEITNIEVTCIKDYYMVELYDDRAVQVEFNTGKLLNESNMHQRQLLRKFTKT